MFCFNTFISFAQVSSILTFTASPTPHCIRETSTEIFRNFVQAAFSDVENIYLKIIHYLMVDDWRLQPDIVTKPLETINLPVWLTILQTIYVLEEYALLKSIGCGGFTNMLQDAVVWFSSGGTKSVLHYDAVDNINCLFDGTKELLMINKVSLPYSSVDERLNNSHEAFQGVKRQATQP